MSEYLQRYLPEYDENEVREKLSQFSAPDLVEMLIRAYKEKRVFLKMLDESNAKLEKVQKILSEPPTLNNMPDVPTADDLRRMNE
jgi:hypothetical protein